MYGGMEILELHPGSKPLSSLGEDLGSLISPSDAQLSEGVGMSHHPTPGAACVTSYTHIYLRTKI